MIRVLQVIGSMNRGGAETMIMNLYRHIDRTQIQFDFVVNTADKAAYDDEILSLGGRIFSCPRYRGKNHFQYVKWWNTFFKEHRGEYRIIHGHLGSTAAIYLNIAKKYGLFTIAHSHNAFSQLNVGGILYKLYSFPTRWIADCFFMCSRAAGISRYGKKVALDENRCIQLNNAIDTGAFTFAPDIRQAVRDNLQLSDKIVIGHIGRFAKQKNHTFLIDVFREIHRINPNTVCLLVGDGELRPSIEQKIEEYGLGDAVVFTGVVSNVSDYYHAMDIFVMPSLFEGLPVTLAEAQTAGLACVISDGVSKESILIDELMTTLSLSEPPEKWARTVLSHVNTERKNCASEIAAKGYDISTTAKWLSDFYLDK